MGFHVSWITVKGRNPEDIRAQLELEETSYRECVPESPVTGAVLPSAWYMVFFNEPLPRELADETLRRLSAQAEVMAFVVEEASMVSLARGYVDGERVWEIVHDSGKGLTHLDVTGTPPTQFSSIRDRLLGYLHSKRNSADYLFDVPAELCKAISGFRHDEDIEGIDGEAFAVLERS